MINLHTCMAEEYKDAAWSLVGEYDEIGQVKDELTSPTFYVTELMIVKVMHGLEIFSTMFYANGEWLSLDQRSKIGNLFASENTLENTSVIEWWRTTDSVSGLMNGLSKVLSKDTMTQLLVSSIVNFCGKNEREIVSKTCAEITEPNKFSVINISLSASTNTCLLSFKNYIYGNKKAYGAAIPIRIMIQNTKNVNPLIANEILCNFIRTQITAPIFLSSIAKRIQR